MSATETITIAGIASRIQDTITTAKDAKFRKARPTSIWASFAGHPCDRNKYHCIADWQERLPARPGLQALFDQGHMEAQASRHDIEEAGFEIVRAEEPLNYVLRGGRHRLISGKIDFFVTGGFLGRRQVPVEHKGLSYGGSERFSDWREMLTAKQVWLRQYPAQMTLYLLMLAERHDDTEGLLALRGKETGQITWLPIELDYAYGETILQSAERVYDALDAGVPPDRMAFDEHTCPICDFVHICAPETVWVAQEVIQDDALQEHLDLLGAGKMWLANAREHDAAVKARFDRVQEERTWRCGDWTIARRVNKKGVWSTHVNAVKEEVRA